MTQARLRRWGRSLLIALLVGCAAACSPETTARSQAWRPPPVEATAAPGWTGVVTGTLRRPGDSGEVLASTRVELCQADSMAADTVTDRDGAFTLRAAGLGPGAYLRVALPGGKRFYRAVAPSGDVVELGTVAVGQARRLEGLAVRPGGEPIAGAALTLCMANAQHGLHVTTRADGEGRFRFETGIAGAAVLKCGSGGISGRPIPVPAAAWESGAQPWAARFTGVGNIFLEVMDADGEPLEDVRVRLEPAASVESPALPEPIFCPTGRARAPRVEQTNMWGVAIFRMVDDVPWDAQLFNGDEPIGSAKGLRIAETAQRVVVAADGQALR